MLDGLPAHSSSTATPSGELCLLETRVDGLECAQESHEGRRQLLQGGYLRSEECIPSAFWLSEEEERGQAGRLELVGDIGVPDCGGDGVVVFEVEGLFQVPK